MNILFICKSLPYPPLRDGLTLYTYMVLKHLSARGHRLSLLCYGNPPEDQKGPLENICKDIILIRRRGPVPSLLRKVAFHLSTHPRAVVEYTSKEMSSAVRRVLTSIPIDILHTHTINMAKNVLDIPHHPKVIHAVDADSLYLLRNFKIQKNPLRKALCLLEYIKTKAFEKTKYPLFDACFVVSSRDRDHLRAMLRGVPIHTATIGVDFHFFSPGEGKKDDTTLVFTGNMDYPPNSHGILYFIRKIFPLVRRSFPEAHLYVVGKNPREDLLRYCSRQIHITGYVEDLRPYLEKSTIYVCPIYSGAGVKNKILEALSMAMPVVASPMVGEGLPLLRQGRDIFYAHDDDDFTRKICRLFSDEGLRRRVGKRAREYVIQNHGWDKTAQVLEEIYSDLLDHRRKGNLP
ncbi:MAG: glycosyltransferase [Pseudomonadota bacterium]